MAGADTIIQGLRAAREDASVRAIILRVDSPGGSGTASDAIWREVQLARRAKPVVASMGDYAASGGFYVAMGADAIVAQPGTITGSIGVFSGKISLRGLYAKLGISQETVSRGRNATLFSSYEPWSDTERAKVREMNLAFYDTFVSKAAEGRKKTPAESRRRPGPGLDRASRRSRAASWMRSAASTPPCAWRASGRASRPARTCSSSCCRRARASSRRSWSARKRTSSGSLGRPRRPRSRALGAVGAVARHPRPGFKLRRHSGAVGEPRR